MYSRRSFEDSSSARTAWSGAWTPGDHPGADRFVLARRGGRPRSTLGSWFLFEEESQSRIVDHRLVVAQDILPDDSADGVSPLHHQPLVGAGHIDREYAGGPQWQPFESQ